MGDDDDTARTASTTEEKQLLSPSSSRSPPSPPPRRHDDKNGGGGGTSGNGKKSSLPLLLPRGGEGAQLRRRRSMCLVLVAAAAAGSYVLRISYELATTTAAGVGVGGNSLYSRASSVRNKTARKNGKSEADEDPDNLDLQLDFDAMLKKRRKKREFVYANETALVMRTVSPIQASVLDGIYRFAKELHETKSEYDFWVIVDETSDVNRTSTNSRARWRLQRYFDMHNGGNGGQNGNGDDAAVKPPNFYSVSEDSLFERFPNLQSYADNSPESNPFNNTGRCCGRPIMWQMFVPVHAKFLVDQKTHQVQEQQPPSSSESSGSGSKRQNYRYRYAWSFEDDIGVVGEKSLLDLIRGWDLDLMQGPPSSSKAHSNSDSNSSSNSNPDVDLAAVEISEARWGKFMHTNRMEEIVQEMDENGVPWRAFSDAIQRHSLALARSVSEEASRNAMQFGERLIYPIVWKHNHTWVDLEHLTDAPFDGGTPMGKRKEKRRRESEIRTSSSSSSSSSVGFAFGLQKLTGMGKKSLGDGIETLLDAPAVPATFVFHQSLPAEKAVAPTRKGVNR